MLSALLLAGLFAAPIAAAAMFAPVGTHARPGEERSRWVARLVATLMWAVILIVAIAGILAAIGVTAANVESATIGLAAASLLWLPVTRRWNAPPAGGAPFSARTAAQGRRRSASAGRSSAPRSRRSH
jgi:hypothetical protein